MTKEKFITKEGKMKLEEELEYRSNKLREEIADRIEEAKKQGDLSENAAYTTAMEDYQLNETRITELKDEINMLVIVGDNSGDDIVHIGDKVEVKDIKTSEIFTYILGGENEANPQQGKISSNSPLGMSLLGKKEGDTVIIELPLGQKEYKIIKVY